MGFVYRVVWVLKALWIVLSETAIWENCIKLTFSGCPRKFYHRVIYIAPSCGHISLNFNTPFTLILKEVWGCFLMSAVRMLHFLKEWWKLIQIHLYYTMALSCWLFSFKVRGSHGNIAMMYQKGCLLFPILFIKCLFPYVENKRKTASDQWLWIWESYTQPADPGEGWKSSR